MTESATLEGSGGSGRRILIIDDTPHIRMFVSVNLTKRGYTVIEAESGTQAIALLREPMPSAIILELHAEHEHNGEVLSHLATHPDASNIPVVVFTTSNIQMEVIKAQCPSVVAVLIKPVEIHALLSTLKEIA